MASEFRHLMAVYENGINVALLFLSQATRRATFFRPVHKCCDGQNKDLLTEKFNRQEIKPVCLETSWT